MANTTGKKHGGRQKGSVNKVTRSLRELIATFLESKWPDIEKDFNKLKPRDKVFLFEKLLNYSLPKYQSLNMNLNQMTEEELEFLVDTLKQKYGQQEGEN